MDLIDKKEKINRERQPEYDMIFLSPPFSAALSDLCLENKEEIFKFLDSLGKVPVYSGRIEREFLKDLTERGIEICDCFADEGFKAENAVPTAEGAIALAISYTKETLWTGKILIIGYGKIGRALAARLKNFTSNRIGIYARKRQIRSEISTGGFAAIDGLGADFGNFNIVFNTAPSKILTKQILQNASENCLIIDLASQPGGTDFEAAKELGIRAIHALALPSKTAPQSAGEIFVDTALKIERERCLK